MFSVLLLILARQAGFAILVLRESNLTLTISAATYVLQEATARTAIVAIFVYMGMSLISMMVALHIAISASTHTAMEQSAILVLLVNNRMLYWLRPIATRAVQSVTTCIVAVRSALSAHQAAR